MPELTIVVKHEKGLHARPAKEFGKTAKMFDSNISVRNGEHTANAQSIITVLGLGVYQGTEITIDAEGNDADETLTARKELINNNFGE